jgi:hypothetical protein
MRRLPWFLIRAAPPGETDSLLEQARFELSVPLREILSAPRSCAKLPDQ